MRTVTIEGVPIGRGSRVRLRSGHRADIPDLALTGRIGEVTSMEEGREGRIQAPVALDGDPSRDLGAGARIGHHVLLTPEEVEAADAGSGPRVLVAGIGNIFLGDDAFGPEVAAALLRRPQPPGVRVADYGIRGLDLAYELLDGYHAVVLIDAAPRGERPGTLYVIEPDQPDEDTLPEAHGMDPVRVLALARRLGGELPGTLLLVGCEPDTVPTGIEDEPPTELSPPVRRAVGHAVRLVERVVAEIRAETRHSAS